MCTYCEVFVDVEFEIDPAVASVQDPEALSL